MRDIKQKSDSLVIEGVLAVVAIALAVFVVVFVYHAKHAVEATYNRAADAAKSIPAQKLAPATTSKEGGWSTYASPQGHFSVQYPSSWVQPQNPEACGPFLDTDLEIGPDVRSVIKCGGDGTVSQISVLSVSGDHRNDSQNAFDTKFYTGVTNATVRAGTTQGTESKAKAINQEEGGLGSLPDGTLTIKDVFFVRNRTYVATYVQLPSSEKSGPVQNQQQVFKTLVSQGLQFK